MNFLSLFFSEEYNEYQNDDVYTHNNISLKMFGHIPKGIFIINDLKLGTSTLSNLINDNSNNDIFYTGFYLQKHDNDEIYLELDNEFVVNHMSTEKSLPIQKILQDSFIKEDSEIICIVKDPYEYVRSSITQSFDSIYTSQNIKIFNAINEKSMVTIGDANEKSAEKEFLKQFLKIELDKWIIDAHLQSSYLKYIKLNSFLETKYNKSIKLIDIKDITEYFKSEFGITLQTKGARRSSEKKQLSSILQTSKLDFIYDKIGLDLNTLVEHFLIHYLDLQTISYEYLNTCFDYVKIPPITDKII